LERSRLTAPLAATVQHFQLDKLVSANAGQTLAYSGSVFAAIGYSVTSVVLALYIIADRDRARGALYAWMPRAYHMRLARVLMNLETIVGGYIRGQVITSLAIALFAFALLSLCRVPNALALACFAGMTDVIPFVGGLLATTPAVLASMSRGGGVAALVLASFLVYQTFEDRVLVPRIYGRVLRLSSATVLIALLVGGELLGVVGALLALPVAAGMRMLIQELRVDLPGDDTDDTVMRARDAREERVYAARTVGADPEEAAAVAGEMAAETPTRDGPK
jgi:predicted PurR-regulated permease PerM